MKFRFLFLLLALAGWSHAQNDTLHLSQAYHTFSDAGKAEWTAFENSWSYHDYARLKAKAGIKKLNCSNCERFYAELYLEIDDKGNVRKAVVLRGYLCEKPLPMIPYQEAFEQSVRKANFKHIQNKQFVARFGHVLKC